jgi:AAA+ superfamily predicted ATPase
VPDEHSKWVLVLRRVFGYENELQRTKLDVKSPFLREILKETVPPVKAAMDSEKASTAWPNDEIFRYRDHIKQAAEKKGGLAMEHAEVLMTLIESEYSGRIEDIQYMFPTGTTNYEIIREAYWPGELIVDACSGRVFRLTGVDYVDNPWDREFYLAIHADYIDHNGKEFGTVSREFQINKFEGVEYFKDLNVFPLKYHPRAEEIKATLLKRGKRFAALKGQHHLNHDGIALTFSCPPSRVTVKSRIMVDTATHNRVNANAAIHIRKGISDELVEGELTDEHYILCTDRIPIFSFQDKRFYSANIKNISEIVYNDRVFDQLVLPDSQKDLVRVLVENHSKGADFDDFVEGKGKGLVSVLHGPPGVGKTMTAEAVAEFTRRPLYIVTSGELGSTPSQMETELERILDLAKTFRAVLLLDEADVFLEQRTTHDLIRNALVSIFLRQLEYYQGILFLTTNRVSTFDEAFHSRIHISLYYQNLTAEAREQVWRNFGEKMDVDLNGDEYEQLATQELNGRQIKNIFRTSQALAADRGERISMRHIRTVLEVMKGFDLAKMKAHGGENANGMEK